MKKNEDLIIRIPFDATGKQRRKILEEQPTRYAYYKFEGDAKKISRWLGISRKAINNRMKKMNLPFPENRVMKDLKKVVRRVIDNGEDIRDTKLYQYAQTRNKKMMLEIYKEFMRGKK